MDFVFICLFRSVLPLLTDYAVGQLDSRPHCPRYVCTYKFISVIRFCFFCLFVVVNAEIYISE